MQDDEEDTFDYLTKTDGAKAAIEHLKKVDALTHKAPAREAVPSIVPAKAVRAATSSL